MPFDGELLFGQHIDDGHQKRQRARALGSLQYVKRPFGEPEAVVLFPLEEDIPNRDHINHFRILRDTSHNAKNLMDKGTLLIHKAGENLPFVD